MNYNKNLIFSGACLIVAAMVSLLILLAIASKYIPFIQDHLFTISGVFIYGLSLITFFVLELIDEWCDGACEVIDDERAAYLEQNKGK